MAYSDPHPRQYLAPLVTANHVWLDRTRAWFDKHPEREFKLTKIPIDAIQAVGLSGWLVGVASRPFVDPDNLGIEIAVGVASVPCIIKRPDPAAGQPNPAVFIMDGIGTMPPLPHSKNATPAQQARAEEKIAAGIWQLAAVASVSGVPLIGALRMAATVRATHRKR